MAPVKIPFTKEDVATVKALYMRAVAEVLDTKDNPSDSNKITAAFRAVAIMHDAGTLIEDE